MYPPTQPYIQINPKASAAPVVEPPKRPSYECDLYHSRIDCRSCPQNGKSSHCPSTRIECPEGLRTSSDASGTYYRCGKKNCPYFFPEMNGCKLTTQKEG